MPDNILGQAIIPIRATLDKLDKDLASARSKVDHAFEGVQNLGKVALGGLAIGAGVAAVAIATIGASSIKAASDLNESQSKANVVFGESIGVINKFAATSARAFGISRQAAYEATGTFGNLFTTMGLGQKPAADMSVNLIQLAGDLASFNNLNPEDVLIKLRAGLVGETEPLRTLGINLTEDTVKAKALAMGLAASEGALTPAMKLQARYALILEQSTNAQGDFARTSGGLANQQRILAATWADLQAKLGTAFLPVVLAVVKAITPLVDALMPKLDKVLRSISPIIQKVADSFTKFINAVIAGKDPIAALQALISRIFPPSMARDINNVIIGVMSFIRQAQTVLAPIVAWITRNISLKDVLIAIAIAIMTVVIPPILSLVASLAAIVAVVAMFRAAWDSDFMGIRTTVTDAWNNSIKPFLVGLWDWLQTNIPVAIQRLSDFWKNVLHPAMQGVGDWIRDNLVPIFAAIVGWLQVNIPVALKFLSDAWTGVLQPALMVVWEWIQANIFPIFERIVEWLKENIPVALKALAGFWTNTLLPALQDVWAFISEKIIPLIIAFDQVALAGLIYAVKFLAALWTNILLPALKDAWAYMSERLKPMLEWLSEAFSNISLAISEVTDWLKVVKTWLDNLQLPSWLQPGSPTPLEIGLLGIADAFNKASNAMQNMIAPPSFATENTMLVEGAGTGSTTNVYVQDQLAMALFMKRANIERADRTNRRAG